MVQELRRYEGRKKQHIVPVKGNIPPYFMCLFPISPSVTNKNQYFFSLKKRELEDLIEVEIFIE